MVSYDVQPLLVLVHSLPITLFVNGFGYCVKNQTVNRELVLGKNEESLGREGSDVAILLVDKCVRRP